MSGLNGNHKKIVEDEIVALLNDKPCFLMCAPKHLPIERNVLLEYLPIKRFLQGAGKPAHIRDRSQHETTWFHQFCDCGNRFRGIREVLHHAHGYDDVKLSD